MNYNKYIDKAIEILNNVLQVLNFTKQMLSTGALIDDDVKDERDVPASAVLTKAKLPKKYLNPKIKKLEVYNQKKLGVCVGTAHTTGMELLYPNVDFSVRFAYRMAKYIDGFKGEGTWGRVMAKVHMQYGAATTATRPENFELLHWLYIKFNFTKEEMAEAKKYKIKGYVFGQTEEEIKGLIKKYGFVTTTIEAKSMWNKLKGYHRIIIVGWDDKGFTFRNSWGKGELQTLPYNVFKRDCIAYIKTETDKKKVDKYIKKVEDKYKYFSAKEAYKMNPEFMHKLDRIRGKIGRPIVITSGYRTAAKNKLLGGAKYSYHLYGDAADIRILDNHFKYDLIKYAYEEEIYGIEPADRHIHLDNRVEAKRAVFAGISK